MTIAFGDDLGRFVEQNVEVVHDGIGRVRAGEDTRAGRETHDCAQHDHAEAQGLPSGSGRIEKRRAGAWWA